MRCVALCLLVVASCIAIDPALEAQCQDWIISNQKDLMFLGQVASQSHIASCQQFCMLAGSGIRADATTCRSLCEQSGGYKQFVSSLSLDNGMASPATICESVLTAGVDVNGAVSMLEVPETKERKLGVRGDMTIQKTLVTNMLTSPVGDVKVSGEMNVMNSIESNSVRAAFFKADSGVSVKSGIMSKKDQLLVKGKIDADSVTMDGLSASFLEIGGVRQWGLLSIEDFEETPAEGWSHGEVTECAGAKMLGGHCVEKGDAEVTKTFTNLGEHSQIRVTAKYMFIDSWDGESGFMKLDGNTVWAESYNHADGAHEKHGINVCGNETPERKWGRPIDVTIPHTGDSFTLSFGATTDEHPCDESFGVDSVMVFVR